MYNTLDWQHSTNVCWKPRIQKQVLLPIQHSYATELLRVLTWKRRPWWRGAMIKRALTSEQLHNNVTKLQNAHDVVEWLTWKMSNDGKTTLTMCTWFFHCDNFICIQLWLCALKEIILGKYQYSPNLLQYIY